MKVTGRCYCGQLRYESEGEVIVKGQCHCRECQYITGGHPLVILGMPASGFKYTAGSVRQFRRSDLEQPVTRDFCPDCGTHIVTRAPGLPDAVLIKVGTLDDPSVFEGPDVVIWTADMQSFHQLPEGVPTFEGFPPPPQ